MAEELQLVDASSVIFRAWFGRPPVLGESGRGRSAIDGWLQFLSQLEHSHCCDMGALAFDESLGSGFRHRLYPQYKAQRSLPDADLAWQLDQCKAIAEALGWLVLASAEYEADDFIASACRRAEQSGMHSRIWSQDKDLIQCLNQEEDRLVRVDRKGEYCRQSVFESFGLWPQQWIDYQALTGDPVDGIPGAPGIGPAAASQLLTRFQHLEGIYRHIDDIPQQAWRGSARHARILIEHKESVMLSRQLAALACDALPFAGVDPLRRRPSVELEPVLLAAGYTAAQGRQWCRRLGLAERALL